LRKDQRCVTRELACPLSPARFIAAVTPAIGVPATGDEKVIWTENVERAVVDIVALAH